MTSLGIFPALTNGPRGSRPFMDRFGLGVRPTTSGGRRNADGTVTIDDTFKVHYADTILELLREWNEDTRFDLMAAPVMVESELLTTCVLHVLESETTGDSRPVTIVGEFGDEDFLYRLVVIDNDNIDILVNDGPLRA